MAMLRISGGIEIRIAYGVITCLLYTSGATELCGYDGDEVVDPPLEELTVLVWKDDEL